MRVLMWGGLYCLVGLLSLLVVAMAWPFLRTLKAMRSAADWVEIRYLLAKMEYQVRRRP